MTDYNPVNACGKTPFTSTTSGTVTAGQIVMASGASTIAAATAAGGAASVGVAAHAAASGAKITVWPLTGVIHETSCPGGAAAGDGIVAGDAGIAVKATGAALAAAAAAGTLLGIALTSPGADAAAVVRFIGRG